MAGYILNEENLKKIEFFKNTIITESKNLHIWGTDIDLISKINAEDYDIIRNYLKNISYREFSNYIYDAVYKECSSKDFFPEWTIARDEIGRRYADNTYGALAQMYEQLFCADDDNTKYYDEYFKKEINRDLLLSLFRECYYTIDGNEKPLYNFNNLFSDNRMHGKIQRDFYQYLSEQDIKVLWADFAEEYIDTERKPAFKHGNIPKTVNSSLEYIQCYIEKLWKPRNAVLIEDPADFTKMPLEDIENMFMELCESCKCGYFNINNLKFTKTDLITLYEYLITLNERELFQRLKRHDEAIQDVVVKVIDEYDLDTHMNWPKAIKEKNSKQLHESIITLVEDIEELIGNNTARQT